MLSASAFIAQLSQQEKPLRLLGCLQHVQISLEQDCGHSGQSEGPHSRMDVTPAGSLRNHRLVPALCSVLKPDSRGATLHFGDYVCGQIFKVVLRAQFWPLLDNQATKGKLEAAGNITLLKTGPSSSASKGAEHFYKTQTSLSMSKDWKTWLPACVAFSTAGTCVYFFYDKAACPRSRFPGFFILQPHQQKHYQSGSTDAR